MAAIETNNRPNTDEGGMGYLQSLPRRVVTVYLPLLIFVIVLLFPFYWMTITAVKPNLEMTDYANFSSSIFGICSSTHPIRAGFSTRSSSRPPQLSCRCWRRCSLPMRSSA
jgi:ABC-type glycerol-3-phosphate transport system permease component